MIERQRASRAGAWLSALGCSALLGAGVGCSGKTEPAPVASASAPALVSADVEDLIEGPVAALGLTMPLGARIRAEDPLGVAVEVPLPMERVSNFFRTRLKTTSVLTGPNRTIFVGVSPPAGHSRPLHLVVRRRGIGAEVYISFEGKAEAGRQVGAPVSKATFDAEGQAIPSPDDPEQPEEEDPPGTPTNLPTRPAP